MSLVSRKQVLLDSMSARGAVVGILIWMQKPNVNEAKRVGVDQSKFLCRSKHKFGLNCQAVADVNGKLLDISVVHGASAADCVAFEASDLRARLEDGILQNGYVLFGNNAYLNLFFMAMPYSNLLGNPNKKSEDNYNFFHSQLRIRVECAFGMLVARWGILRMVISNKIAVMRTIALVNTLARRLHNFCLEELIPNQLEIDTENIIN